MDQSKRMQALYLYFDIDSNDADKYIGMCIELVDATLQETIRINYHVDFQRAMDWILIWKRGQFDVYLEEDVQKVYDRYFNSNRKD